MNIKFSSSHKKPEPESGVLYIVGTPIGNLNDLSYRVINILKNVSLIACEDTRQTKKIMSKFEFTNNLISFNKHNSMSKIPRIINELKANKSIAEISAIAQQAAEATIPLKATRGRASFLGDRSIGHMDPGAFSSALMIQTICQLLEEKS